MHAGDLFHVPPVPHDSWVVGDEPYVSLHFFGAERYACDLLSRCSIHHITWNPPLATPR